MARSVWSSRKSLVLLCAMSSLLHAQQPRNRDLHNRDRRNQAGGQIFATRCATCHGLDGQGAERGPNIATRREVQRLSDPALSQIVRRGIPSAGMPSFRVLDSAKIAAVVQHLRALQGLGISLPLPGDPDRGKALFSGKAQCAQCHAVNGEGGFLGADLTSYANSLLVYQIRAAITDPNMDLDPHNQTLVVTSGDGTTTTGMARNEDNFSLQLQTIDGAFHSFTKTDLRRIERQPYSLMPSDYGTKLNQTEVDDVVSYLMKVGRTHPRQKPAKKDD